MVFLLDERRNFFSVSQFNAANLVFSARFGAVLYCFNFGFCSTTYVHPLSHLPVLGFVTFVFYTLRCHLFFKLRPHTFLFINSCAFSYCLSFLLPEEASDRNVVNCTACCCIVRCFLNYVSTFRPRWMLELLLCCSLRCSHSRLFCAIRCCLLLLQLCLRFNHLRPSAFSSFSTVFLSFSYFSYFAVTFISS